MFAAATTSYTDSVAYAITVSQSHRQQPVPVRPSRSMERQLPAAAPPGINLNVGSNTITSHVTAQDGTTTKTYTITVTRAHASANADLSNLTRQPGHTHSDVCSSHHRVTRTALSNGVTSITVTPTAAGTGATIHVNGTVVASGAASQAINLNVGSNTITTVVTAQDGTTTRTYTLTVTRAGINQCRPERLTVSQGTLVPMFAAATTSYTDSVANGSPAMTVTPTAAGYRCDHHVNGTVVTSGSASASPSIQCRQQYHHHRRDRPGRHHQDLHHYGHPGRRRPMPT